MPNIHMSEAARSVIELIDVGWEDFKSGNMTRAHLTMQEAQVLATLLVAERLPAHTGMESPPSNTDWVWVN